MRMGLMKKIWQKYNTEYSVGAIIISAALNSLGKESLV